MKFKLQKKVFMKEFKVEIVFQFASVKNNILLNIMKTFKVTNIKLKNYNNEHYLL